MSHAFLGDILDNAVSAVRLSVIQLIVRGVYKRVDGAANILRYAERHSHGELHILVFTAVLTNI